MLVHSLVFAFVGFSASAIASSCECGYQTSTGDIWQYAITTDFTQVSDAAFVNSSDWTIMTTYHANSSSDPYAINYTSANVAVKSSVLELTCSAYDESSDSMTINAGEITTTRSDILYGSFRSRHKFTGGSGAVGAIFFYSSDTQEIDIELLTHYPAGKVSFTNQPSTTNVTTMPDKLTREKYVDYRFDWNPSYTRFYVNNQSLVKFTEDVPDADGTIKLNSWANGGSFAGASVPTSDAVLSVEWIDLYFNTSDSTKAKAWKKSCASANTQPCSVDSTTSSSTSAQTQTSGASRRHPAFFRR